MPDPARQLGVDAVIATRNRAEALAVSVPLLLAQSYPLAKLIVIDSSDDHAPVAETLAAATQNWSGEVIVEHSAPGLPRQRNLGLRHVTADIVLFPDDDSLLHPGALEAIMEVYRRDRDGEVVGVAASEAFEPPSGALPEDAWKPSTVHRREAAWAPLRYRIDRRLQASNPFFVLGGALQKTPPSWLGAVRAVPVEYMTGFRMSFRTPAIKAIGFDETLTGHALGEDIEASFAVATKGTLVGARNAMIYHHRFPGGRGDGFRQGAVSVLNRTYIVCKHLAQSDLPRSRRARVLSLLTQYFRLRGLSYLARSRQKEARAQLRGMRRAAPLARRLRGLASEDLVPAYRAAMEELGL